jgi:bifunctional DNA-binding transcriptional regulator/antitoxin component of YhaV-PrlF toxin-antitoxin module
MGKKYIRKITKVSNGTSYSITLPIEVVREWKWKERQKLELEIDEKNKKIVIKDWKK